MNKITWIDPYLDLVLNEIPIEAKDILEVGCGSGILGYIIKQTRDTTTLDGIEPFNYTLPHDHVIRNTWQEWYEPNSKVGYDVLVCNETIEHMKKDQALRFLKEVKTIAKTVIITTPFNWDDQPAYDDNPYQVHQSLLSVDDFLKENYTVRLIGLGQFPPRPKFIRNLYRKKKDTFTKLGIKKTPVTSSRMMYPVKMKKFYELLGIKPNNILAVWQK